MRQQGLLKKITALLVLFALVIQASASVASCTMSTKGMTCCNARVPSKPVANIVAETHDCCNPAKTSAPTGSQMSEGKGSCHCLKSVPPKLLSDLTSVIVTGTDELVAPTEPATEPQYHAIEHAREVIEFADLPPPIDNFDATHSGRAPPVSVK